MAVKKKAVAAAPKARRGPLADSGNGYAPAHEFIAALKGKERLYGEAQLRYILRGGTRPEPTCKPERGREIQQALFNIFSTEDPS